MHGLLLVEGDVNQTSGIEMIEANIAWPIHGTGNWFAYCFVQITVLQIGDLAISIVSYSTGPY